MNRAIGLGVVAGFPVSHVGQICKIATLRVVPGKWRTVNETVGEPEEIIENVFSEMDTVRGELRRGDPVF